MNLLYVYIYLLPETEQDPVVLVPHVFMEFQRKNLIRKVRKCRSKGKQSSKTKAIIVKPQDKVKYLSFLPRAIEEYSEPYL